MNQHYFKFAPSAKFLGAICGGLLIGLPAIFQVAVAQQQPNLKVNPCPSIFYEEPHNNRVFVPERCPPNAITRQAQQRSGVSAEPAQQQIRQGVGGETPYNGGSNSQDYNYSSQRQSTTTRSGQDISSSSSETQTYTSQGPTGGYTVRTTETQSNPTSQRRQNSVVTPLPEQRQAPIALVTPANGKVSVRLKNNTKTQINYEAIGHTERRVLSGGEEVVLQNLPLPVSISTVRQDNGFVRVIPASAQSGLIELSLDEQSNVNDNQGVIRIQEDGKVFLN